MFRTTRLIELSRQEKIKAIAFKLLESQSADHLINQAHYKIPGDRVAFPWHQDIQNRRNFDPKWEDIRLCL